MEKKSYQVNFQIYLLDLVNLLNLYEALEPELKMFFIEEFISDSDKLIEYDVLDNAIADYNSKHGFAHSTPEVSIGAQQYGMGIALKF